MSRIYGRDVIKDIEDYLKDATTGINAMLQTIDSERAESLYSKTKILDANINPQKNNGQTPALYIDIATSEMTGAGNLAANIDFIEDTYNVNIIIVCRDISTDLINMLYNYEEALKRCLHGSHPGNVSIIMYQSSEKVDYDTQNNYRAGAIVVNFEAKVL